MRIARLSNPWLPVFAIALCVFAIYSNIYSSPFVFDDKTHIAEKAEIGNLDHYLSFDRLRQLRGIVYLTFALNYRFGGLNVFGYHLVNVLIHMTNGILAYFLSLAIYRQLSPSVPDPSADPTGPTPKTKRKKSKKSQMQSVKGAKKQARKAIPSNRSARTVASQSTINNQQSIIHWMALFAALIFVAHPIQTQAVNYTVQRIAAMAAMFFLASVLFYIKARVLQQREKDRGQTSEVGGQRSEVRGRKSKARSYGSGGEGKQGLIFQVSAYYALSVSCAVLAFLSKQNTACLPLMILLVEYMLFDRTWAGWKRRLIYLAPVFLLFGIFILHTIGLFRGELDLAKWLEDVSENLTETKRVGRWAYLCTQFNVMVIYIRLLFFPTGQNLDPMYPFKSGFFDGLTPLAFLFLLALIVVGAKNIKKRPIISLGIFWFFITLSVESSIIPINDAMFEHRLYLPLFGFALVVTYLIFQLLSKTPVLAICIAFLAVLLLGAATYLRNRVWQDSITLWSDVVSKNRQAYRGFYNLGNALARQKDLARAIPMYIQAVNLKPDYVDAHYNLGRAFEIQGKLDQAIHHFSETVRIYPRDGDAWHRLAVALVRKGNIEEAIFHYAKAVQVQPASSLEGGKLRLTPKGESRFELAMKNYCRRSQRVIKPGDVERHYDLALALAWLGKLDEAVSHYDEVLREKPDYAEAHYHLGIVLVGLKRPEEAEKHFTEALRTRPDYEEAREKLEQLRSDTGNTRKKN